MRIRRFYRSTTGVAGWLSRGSIDRGVLFWFFVGLADRSLAFDLGQCQRFGRCANALAERRNLHVQGGIGVEVDFGTFIAKVAPRAIIAGVKVCGRRKFRIAILLG